MAEQAVLKMKHKLIMTMAVHAARLGGALESPANQGHTAESALIMPETGLSQDS